MKNLKILTLSFIFTFLTFSCSEDEVSSEIKIPENFTVAIPSAISNGSTNGLSARTSGDGDGTIEGDEIYSALPYFIRLGESSAEIIEFTLLIAVVLEEANIRSYTFEDEEDGREKRIDLEENVIRGGVNYEFEMTMVDIESGEEALQLLWNTANGIEGVGILRPYNINRLENINHPDAYYQIEYSENDPNYEATMLVSLAGVNLDEDGNGTIDEDEKGNIDNLKMFVGKNGDIVEVMGNSNHPELTIIDPDFTGGRNYAFVGRGNETENIGVVELALPPSSVSTDDVLDDYSVRLVLEEEIDAVIELDQTTVDAILEEAGSPAYFNASGFISAGADRPDGFTTEFSNLEGMKPFVPSQIRDLEIGFID